MTHFGQRSQFRYTSERWAVPAYRTSWTFAWEIRKKEQKISKNWSVVHDALNIHFQGIEERELFESVENAMTENPRLIQSVQRNIACLLQPDPNFNLTLFMTFRTIFGEEKGLSIRELQFRHNYYLFLQLSAKTNCPFSSNCFSSTMKKRMALFTSIQHWKKYWVSSLFEK